MLRATDAPAPEPNKFNGFLKALGAGSKKTKGIVPLELQEKVLLLTPGLWMCRRWTTGETSWTETRFQARSNPETRAQSTSAEVR